MPKVKKNSIKERMITYASQPYVANNGAVIHLTALIGGVPEHLDYINSDVPMDLFDVVLGEGIWINSYVTIDKGMKGPTVIGDNTVILAKAHVGHDAVIGKNCVLTTGCIIGGHVTLGNNVKVGLGAVILPHRTVGNGATIGAGAVVTKDVEAGTTVCGNPAIVLPDAKRDPLPFTDRPS